MTAVDTPVIGKRAADPLRRLRLQAIIAAVLGLLAASAIPAVEYGLLFQHSNLTLGPHAWGHWGVVLLACLLGVLAHATGSTALTALHAAAGCMLGAALGGYNTSFWYSLSNRCATAQFAFAGCADCTCAMDSSCTAADLAAGGMCPGCDAYPAEVCYKAQQQVNKFLLAFTGLTTVLSLAIPACFSLVVLVRSERRAAEHAARRTMVAFAVDQQTTLVASGDKPTVTPAMLTEWVNFLLDCGDAQSLHIAAKCRQALSSRGFDLPVAPRAQPAAGKKGRRGRKGKQFEALAAGAAAAGEDSKGTSGSLALAASSAGLSGQLPASPLANDNVYSEAEAGRRSVKSYQVTAGDSLYPSVQ